MRRREFIAGLGTMAWPLAVRAQQAAMPSIGWLGATSAQAVQPYLAAFRKGLNEIGYVEGQNVTIEYRWAEGQYDRLSAMAADLVRRKVTVIAASPSPAAIAAKAATATIPIVFTSGFDAVRIGLVASLNRPGGNITGVSLFSGALSAKRLQLARELAPNPTLIALLVNPTNENAQADTADLKETARAIGQELVLVEASNEKHLDSAFVTIVQRRVAALIVGTDAFFYSRRAQLVALAARYAVPSIFEDREMAEVGGLLAYGASLLDVYRQAGVYTARILKGEKPADLPVQQPTKFDLVINLKTAKALGLTIPETLLATADEVIQ
jgi:putative tryptophan/tyrosine transport system substrate-binding protein